MVFELVEVGVAGQRLRRHEDVRSCEPGVRAIGQERSDGCTVVMHPGGLTAPAACRDVEVDPHREDETDTIWLRGSSDSHQRHAAR